MFSEQDKQGPSDGATKARKGKAGRNILFEADSNGKEVGWEISKLLSKKLKQKNFNVSATARPGAPMVEVVRSARMRMKDMNDDDWMVLLGGANGLNECECGVEECMTEVEKLGKDLKHNNKHFLIVETPYRYDTNNTNINHKIQNQNAKLKMTSDKLGCPYVRLNDSLNRYHYTRHGLHLNRKGKEVLASLIVSSVKYSPQHNPSTFLPEVSQVEQER